MTEGSTVIAIIGSIHKWDSIRRGRGIDRGTTNCSLCEKFLDFGTTLEEVCTECPVYLKTGVTGCNNTPFVEWFEHHRNAHHESWSDLEQDLVVHRGCKDCFKLATKEFEFLKGLLPEGVTYVSLYEELEDAS